MRFFLERSGGKTNGRIHGLAYTLKAIAQHWVKVDANHLEELRAICRRVSPGRHGIADKNRALLRQLDQPRNVAALLNLPQKIFAEAGRKKAATRTEAMTVQIALAIEILIMVPMRIGNLVALDLDRHMIRSSSRGRNMVQLFISAAEVKNRTDIEAVFPKSTVDLLDTYLTVYRPILLDSATPSRPGSFRAATAGTRCGTPWPTRSPG